MINSLTKLKGQTFTTLSQNRRFTVESIDNTGIHIFVHSTENNRIIFWTEIEKSYTHLQQQGTITQTYILNEIGSRSSAYIVVFLSLLPNVSYQRGPLRLYYDKNKQ